MIIYRVFFILIFFVTAAFALGGQDQGGLSLEPRQEYRCKVFNDGRSIIAYSQSGTMTGGSTDGPWQQGNTPISFEIKAGTGKWKGIAGKGKLLDGETRWEIYWSIANLKNAANRCKPDDYTYHDYGFSFHGAHITDATKQLANGVVLIYNNQSGVLLSDDREAKSPRNFATCYDRGTTYRVGDKDLADIMLLEDTDPDGDIVWLYHEWWYGKRPGSYEFIGGTGKWQGISGYGKSNGVLHNRVDDHWLIKSEMHWNLK